MLFLRNAITKRQLSIKRAFPDALDLLLICVESGMSIEMAFRKVSVEIGAQSVALAEEFTLTTAELSYLQDRKVAYENLAKRTGLDRGTVYKALVKEGVATKLLPMDTGRNIQDVLTVSRSAGERFLRKFMRRREAAKRNTAAAGRG